VKLASYCHADDKGERRNNSYSFLTSALDGSEWSKSCPSRDLPPGNQAILTELFCGFPQCL
jgi:hypothetical protein